jgi:uncharacterized damage-inducible protein DinB
MSILRLVYGDWPAYNRHLRDVIAAMTDAQLAERPAPEGWPMWATVAHTAGARAYWLCGVAGEPGLERTPFANMADGIGWEDDLGHPRAADELTLALDATFALIEGCLERWTPEMLAEEIRRERGGRTQVHTRASILQRLFSHEAYHCGELSQTLGILGLPQIDLWPPGDHAA